MTPNDLIKWRARHGFNKTQACKALGISRPSLNAWESGTSAIPHVVMLACKSVDQDKRLAGWRQRKRTRTAIQAERITTRKHVEADFRAEMKTIRRQGKAVKQ